MATQYDYDKEMSTFQKAKFNIGKWLDMGYQEVHPDADDVVPGFDSATSVDEKVNQFITWLTDKSFFRTNGFEYDDVQQMIDDIRLHGSNYKTVFGNGFDIAHNINTPYSSFRKYLFDNQESFLTQFEAMYHIQPLDPTEPWYSEAAQEKWEKSVLVDLWKYFEEKIGFPDVDGMHDMAESLVDSMPVEGIKDTLDIHWKEQYRFAESFQKFVLEWLETLNISNCSCKKKELLNNKTDMFINFNYTDTLERIYKIDNVLHIHGGFYHETQCTC